MPASTQAVTEPREVKREYHFVQVMPYRVISVKDDGRVFVRFSSGVTVILDTEEFLVLSRIPAHYATVPFNTGKEVEVLNNLKKLGVVHEIERPKTSFYFVYKVTKGCNLACKYCLSGDTRILMADGSWKPIKEIREGDEVVGWDQKTNRLVKTKVLRTFKRRDTLYLVQTDKASIKVTDNHAILGVGYWYALDPEKASHEVENARKLYIDTILRFVTFPNEFAETEDYMLGYLSGVFYRDGTYVGQISAGTGRSRYLRLVVTDKEIIDRVKKYMDMLGIHYTEGTFRATSDKSYKKGEYQRIYVTRKDDIERIREIHENNKEWLRGFVAGFFDAEGSVPVGRGGPRVGSSVSSVRLSNTSEELLRIFKLGLDSFGFKYSEYVVQRKKGKPQKIIYLLSDGEVTAKVRFFTVFRPAVSRKVERLLATKYRRTIVTDIKKLGEDWVYNLHTGTGTYIAEGLIVHNCYEWANPEKIPQKTSIEIADKLLSMSQDSYVNFVFHGGEPTLYFEDVIVPVVTKWLPPNKDSPEHKRLKFGMQSNGVRFADENFAKKFAEFHKKYGITVGISLDGKKEHNWLRQFPDGTPAWEFTVQGIKNLHKYGVEGVGLIIVVNDRSVKDFVGIADWLVQELNITRSRFNPLYPAGHPEVVKHAPDPEEYIDQTIKLAKWEIEKNLDGDEIKPYFVSTTIAEHVQAMLMRSSNVCVNTVCGRGMSFFAIEPNGDVKPCDHSSRVLGNVLDGWTVWDPVPPELAREWAEQSWHFSTVMGGHSECESCPYRQFCDGGGCPEFLTDIYGKEYWKQAPRYCWKRFYKFIDKIIESGDLIRLAALDPIHLKDLPWVNPS